MKDRYVLNQNKENARFNLRNKLVPLVSVLILCTMFLLPKIADAATHYVSPKGASGAGAWAASTDINSPCSLATAKNYASAGDTINLRAGIYDEDIRPNNSGTSEAQMVWQAYHNEEVIFDMDSGTPRDVAVLLDDRSYITIDGLTMRDVLTNFCVTMTGSASMQYGNIIKNCVLDGCGITADTISGLQILNTTINNASGGGIAFGGSESNRMTQSRIENVTISGVGNGDAITLHEDGSNNPMGDYHLIKNVTVQGSVPENCFDIVSGSYIVLDGVVCDANTNDPGFLVGGYQGASRAQWVRIINSEVYDIGSAHINLGGEDLLQVQILRSRFHGTGKYLIRAYTEQPYPTLGNLRIFHNVFDATDIDNGASRPGLYLYDSGQPDHDSIKAKNNIFVQDASAKSIRWQDPNDGDLVSDYNLYYDTRGTGQTIWASQTLAGVRSSYSQEANGIDGNPSFTDFGNNDYTLQTGSPAIDAGGWLTTITQANGSGTSFTVADPYWFYDGWYILGEKGDVIKTAGGQTATIISINYSAKQIKVDKKINWTNGEGIGLDYQGSRPDIGATESGYLSSSTIPSAPKGLRVMDN